MTMGNPDSRILVGQLVEEELTLTLDELSGVCAVARERIMELLELGVFDARTAAGDRVSGEALRRARLALRLQRDLELNAAGAALVVELLDRIDELEAQLRVRTST
jgi:chaperone modulatory protein CbpM